MINEKLRTVDHRAFNPLIGRVIAGGKIEGLGFIVANVKNFPEYLEALTRREFKNGDGSFQAVTIAAQFNVKLLKPLDIWMVGEVATKYLR